VSFALLRGNPRLTSGCVWPNLLPIRIHSFHSWLISGCDSPTCNPFVQFVQFVVNLRLRQPNLQPIRVYRPESCVRYGEAGCTVPDVTLFGAEMGDRAVVVAAEQAPALREECERVGRLAGPEFGQDRDTAGIQRV